MLSRRLLREEENLPPLLVRVIAAAAVAGDKGHASALCAFGRLALVEVPGRGVLAPCNPGVQRAIEELARAHLGMDDARKELRDALAEVEPFARRDAIESAHNHVGSVSDETYFYVGLAYGITLATLGQCASAPAGRARPWQGER
jgi:hypothetical protein